MVCLVTMVNKKKALLLGLIAFFSIVALHAEPLIPPVVAAPGSEDNLDVYLAIVGRENPMYSWWGHVGIVVADKRTNGMNMYDYGTFSFESKNFYTDFAKGRLWFLTSVVPFPEYIDYIIGLDRDMRVYRLTLAKDKKRALQAYLEWNELPENRLYLYHHYRDNCSTRIRDLLDDLTDGQLREQTTETSGMTLRQLSRKYARDSIAGDYIIDFLLSGKNDYPVTEWEEMFIPEYMERTIIGFSYKNSLGETIPLVAASKVVHVSRAYKPIPIGPFKPVWHRGIIAGILFALPALLLFFFGRKKSFEIYRLVFCFLAGIPGTALFFLMFFSNHDVMFDNWNILIVSPLCLLMIPFSIFSWKKKGILRKDGTRLSSYLMNVLCVALCSLAAIAFIAAKVPAWRQDTTMIFLTFIFPYLSFLLPLIKKREALN